MWSDVIGYKLGGAELLELLVLTSFTAALSKVGGLRCVHAGRGRWKTTGIWRCRRIKQKAAELVNSSTAAVGKVEGLQGVHAVRGTR